MDMYSKLESVMQNHINDIVDKRDALIMSKLKKQKGFVNFEESKHLIEVNRMFKNDHHVGTDYIFDGKRFLTIYPTEFTEENGKFKTSVNYLEYP